jgi:hypothetical protein
MWKNIFSYFLKIGSKIFYKIIEYVRFVSLKM